MSNKIQGDLSDYISAPIEQGIVNVAVAQTVVIIDLTSMAGWPGNQVNGTDVGQVGRNPNPLGHYITIQADGGNVNIAFAGLATTISAITTTATSTVSGSNQLNTTYTTNGTIVIPSGTERAFLLPEGPNPATTPWAASSPARFLGLIAASGTTTVRMWQSSY